MASPSNVHNIFLHGDLDEEINVKALEDLLTKDDNKVYKLQKSLHGLKQAS